MNKITQFRKSRGLTQSGLAKMLGVSQALVTHVETGRRQFGYETVLRFEKISDGEITRSDLRPDIYPQAHFETRNSGG